MLWYDGKRSKYTIMNYLKTNLLNTRILKFSVVGVSGVLVNMGILFILTEYFHILYLISSIIAIEMSIISNFLLNDIWTWRDRTKKKFIYRFVQYHISVGITAVLVNWGILFILTEVFDVYYLISNLIGIGVGTLSNYIINDLWTFRTKKVEE